MRFVSPRLVLRVACALSGGLCMAAGAQSVSVPFNATFKGSVEIRGYPGDNACIQLYTVPVNMKLRITDYALDAYGSTTPLPYQYICSGKPTCSAARSAYITAPAGTTLVNNLTTGILIMSGETLSVCNYAGKGHLTSWTFNGFLYQ